MFTIDGDEIESRPTKKLDDGRYTKPKLCANHNFTGIKTLFQSVSH